MALEDALPGLSPERTPGRLARWLATAEPDWDAVYAEQLPRVFNFFRYRLGNTADAEDLTSRTFEKAWAVRHRYRRDVASFSTWLMSIARNVAIDHGRARREQVPLDEADHVTTWTTPEAEAVRRSDAHRLAALLLRLPDRERELIAMKYGAEMNNRAIARAIGLSESNVGTILHRAIQKLRVEWAGEHRTLRRTPPWRSVMNDDFLYSLKREPAATFRAELRERLRHAERAKRSLAVVRRLRVGLQAVAAAAVIVVMFTFPAVRASAQSFLALFRANSFLAVPVDSQRVSDLSRRIDLERLLGRQVEAGSGSRAADGPAGAGSGERPGRV